MDIDYIERLAKEYAEARDKLGASVVDLEVVIAEAKRRMLPTIKRRASTAADAKARLQAAVEGRPDLFRKPKTRILHGIKVGFAKGKGKISFASAAQVVKLIRKHLPESFDILVKVEEKPIKSALGQLSGAELKKIGVTVTEAGDQAVVAPADSEIDKLVDALLAGAEDPGSPSGAGKEAAQ